MSVENLREVYVQLWQVIFDRHNHRRGGDVTQASVAKSLNKNPSVISRLMTGTNIPRSMNLIVGLASALEAKPREIRILLAWASALICYETGQKKAGPYFEQIFSPLFDQQSFGEKLFSAHSLAKNVLLDLGVDPKRAADFVNTLPDDLSAVMMSLTFDSPAALAGVMENVTLPKLSALRATYENIAVGECDEPPRVRGLARAVRNGAKIGVWRRIPNVSITKITLPPGKSVRDSAHEGYEFLFVLRGKGEFRMNSLTPIALDDHVRWMIGYRPSTAHTFTAGDVETSFFVLSYIRGADNPNPAEDVLRAAKAELEGLRRLAKARTIAPQQTQ